MPEADLIELGRTARHEGRLEAARRLYRDAAQLYHEAGDRQAYAKTVRHIADIYMEEPNYAEAQPLYEEALEIYRGDVRTGVLDLANAIRPYALLIEATGQGETAAKLWREAQALYAAIRVEAGVKECEEHLARLEE